jgi:hypothetical protein
LYEERNAIDSVLAYLVGRNTTPTSTKIVAQHLHLTVSASSQTVTPGQPFSLFIDGTPAKRIHVYAPGATNYKPIALQIDSKPGLLVGHLRFPEPGNLYFKPLDEHVPVYQRPFRLEQPITVSATHGLSTLVSDSRVTITGMLVYQACNDTTCFDPQSIPLSWTFEVSPLKPVRGRR